MKKKELEIILQKVPSFDKPTAELEQYLTPANIAADIIFIAYQFGDIENKIVLDLGCGTGIFSFGASLTGAKKVVGVDIDKSCINIAKEYAKKTKQKITFIAKGVGNIEIKCDTVIMNPPFGAQKSNLKADRKFMEKGFELSSVIYSLHLSKTVPFIERLVKSLGGEISYSKKYIFPIKHTFDFHKKKTLDYEVSLLRILTKR